MNQTWSTGLLASLRQRWRDIPMPSWGRSARPPAPDLPEPDRARLAAQMRECLEARGGEVSARSRAAELGRIYLGLSPQGRRRFLATLADPGQAPEQVRLGDILAGDGWARDEARRAALELPVIRAAARYLVLAKRDDGLPWDPVARFHLSNGAEIHRLNWLADASANGLKQSLGVMVNYRYALDEIEANHEAYARDHAVATSSAIAKLAAS